MMEWGTMRPKSETVTTLQRPITGKTDIRLPGPLVIRILIWFLLFLLCPLSVTAAWLSFQIEVIGCKTSAIGARAFEVERRRVQFVDRVLHRLETAERRESDPWLRDDIRIAWITTLYASQGNSQPHIDATYRVLGVHPDNVWPAICARRAALLGRAVPIPHNKKQPMAANREGDAPQKTCAYGAAGNTSSTVPRADECRFSTGSSCRTETKREARRIRTTEFGLHDAPPAAVAAAADKKPCATVRGKQVA